MRINTGEKVDANISVGSGVSSNPDTMTKSSVIDTGKATANTKNISQMNDYDINNMPVSEKIVIEAIQRANKAISGGNRRFEFSIHEKTNEIVVKVFDSETNVLIREIPNEKVLDMVAKMCEMAGILVDERR